MRISKPIQPQRYLQRLLLALAALVSICGQNLPLHATDKLTDKLTPHLVDKYFEKSGAEIPKGMYLKRTRTGELWLLPKSMSTPPDAKIEIDYYTRPKNSGEAEKIGRIGKQVVLDSPLSAEDTFLDGFNFYSRLPRKFAELLRTDKLSNLHAKSSPDLLSLGKFGPAEENPFLVPYIPIPETDFDFAYVSELSQESTVKLVKFNRKGRPHYRFFIHPNYVDSESYEDLIKKYGIVYHYIAMTTSSPRSLIVIDPDKKDEVYWIKPSLHKKLDGSIRTNHDGKVRRAVIMSEAMAGVPKSELRKMQVQTMLEPAALLPKGKQAGTIFREIAPELLRPKPHHTWIPALSLKAPSASDSKVTVLAQMVKKSNKSPAQFITEDIVRPLLRSYLSLGLIEGLPGELHVQNFYYETNDRTGLPTGKILLKDNDGFRFDVELAIRRGRGLEFLSHFDKPFYWAKFSNARGYGGDGVPFIGSWYYKLIRNVNGFETLSAYCLAVLEQMEPRAKWNNDKIQRLFDDVAAEVAESLVGRKITPKEYGYGYDKGLNVALNYHRAEEAKKDVASHADVIQNDSFQNALRKEFERLEKEKRVSVMHGYPSERSRFILHANEDGSVLIEAINPGRADDPTIGFALLEPSDERHGQQARQRLIKAYKLSGLGGSCGDLLRN